MPAPVCSSLAVHPGVDVSLHTGVDRRTAASRIGNCALQGLIALRLKGLLLRCILVSIALLQILFFSTHEKSCFIFSGGSFTSPWTDCGPICVLVRFVAFDFELAMSFAFQHQRQLQA